LTNETYPFSDLRERAAGNQDEATFIEEYAVLADSEVESSILTDVAGAFEGRRFSFEETRRGRRVARQLETSGMQKAIRHGDNPLVEYLRGLGDNKTKMGAWELLREMSEVMAQPASVTTLKGDMGSGKTDFAGLLAELIEFGLFQRYGREFEIRLASNVESFVEFANAREDDETESQKWHAEWEFINNFRDLVERLDEQKSSGAHEEERLVYILDEGCNHVTGYGQDANDAVEMGKMIRLIRKANGSMIIIGHSHDIAPIILRMSNLIVEKVSEQEADEPKKEARVYKRAGKDEDARDLELIRPLKEIPPTKYDFETHESSDVYWGDEEGEQMYSETEVREQINSIEGEMRREFRDWYIYHQREEYQVKPEYIADEVGLSESRISQIVGEMRDELESRGVGESQEAAPFA